MTDWELLQKYVQRRSNDAMNELVRRHAGMVQAVALRELHDVALAEDVTQAVFLVLMRRAGDLSARTLLPGWLFKTTLYAVADVRRERNRRRRHEREAVRMQTQSLTESPDPKALEMLNQAFARLNAEDRNVLILRYFEDQPAAQIAAVLGGNENAARQRVFRAIERLRQQLVRGGHAIAMPALTATLESARAASPSNALGGQLDAMIRGTLPGEPVQALAREVQRMLMRTKLVTMAAAGGGAALLLTAGISIAVMAQGTPAPGTVTFAASAPAGVTAPATRDAAVDGMKVLEIEFVGNTRIDSQVLLDRLGTQPPLTTRGPYRGKNSVFFVVRGRENATPYSKESVATDVKTLAAMDLFSTVRSETVAVENGEKGKGVIVRFVLEERPEAATHAPGQTPKGTLMAARAAAVSGDGEGLVRCFDGADDLQLVTLRQAARLLSAYEQLSKALQARYGAVSVELLQSMVPNIGALSADIQGASEVVNDETAIVSLKESTPAIYTLRKVDGVWKIDASVLEGVDAGDVGGAALNVPAIVRLARAIDENRYRTGAEALLALRSLLKGEPSPLR